MEPKNKAIQDTYRLLTQRVQEKINKSNSTVGMIEEMVGALKNPSEVPERRKQAMKNLAIYAHQSAGRDILLRKNHLQTLIPVLSANAECCVYLMKMLHGFCENNFRLSLRILELVPVSTKLKGYVTSYSSNTELVTNALSLVVEIVQAIVEHIKAVYKLDPNDERKNMKVRENKETVGKALEEVPQYIALLDLLVQLLSDEGISAEDRDFVIDAFIKILGYHKAIGDFILKHKGICKMLELASLSCFPMLKETCAIPVNAKTYIHVSVALCTIFENIQYYDKEKDEFFSQAESIINRLIDSQNPKHGLQGLVALSTLIMATREGGQTVATKSDIISKVLVLACNKEEVYQRFSAETLALAATDKSVCTNIVNTGLDILKVLYHSDSPDVRVRSLVALCKVCMKGSGNAKEQILSDDGAVKLYKTCRKFLLSTKKEFSLKKWACEGLAYLTLDADVKEILISDTEALKALLELADSEDATITYGICNALVNLTNSYDKPEKNPELEAIAKYAKQPLPEPHEKDGESYVKKRIHALMEHGLVVALVNFSKTESQNTREMMARIFHAIVEEVLLRGKVVAQGGGKTLLPLALEGTEKGMDFAAQALAKIAITNDPSLAFPGQRCLEVVRPMIKLLHFTKVPLLRFEGLMALTNLASLSDDVRKRIMTEKGFQEIEALMFDEDDLLKQAAVECMCNLVLNEEALKMYKLKDSTTERLKLIVLLSGEDPPELARAAAGTLATLTSDKEICKGVLEISSYLDIMKFLVSSENLELRHRGIYITANLIESSKEIAVKLIEDELFECLMAVKMLKTNTGIIKKQLDRCFDASEKWGIIARNPSANA